MTVDLRNLSITELKRIKRKIKSRRSIHDIRKNKS